ncbi:SHOCT domain-containing protein [Agreia sp.]|uniref:SHOCT domain-containing protein n=1 Tax=Agreia sp. TaxID=1872416 RepID=UPI0035BC79BA
MSNLWDVIWTSFLIFAFVVNLLILLVIVQDIFRDRALNGWYKVLWIVFLVWLPYLTAFVYLIARGRGMGERQQKAFERNRTAASEYIRDAAGTSPADEIEHAKALLDSGTITTDEFGILKAKALA